MLKLHICYKDWR